MKVYFAYIIFSMSGFRYSINLNVWFIYPSKFSSFSLSSILSFQGMKKNEYLPPNFFFLFFSFYVFYFVYSFVYVRPHIAFLSFVSYPSSSFLHLFHSCVSLSNDSSLVSPLSPRPLLSTLPSILIHPHLFTSCQLPSRDEDSF